MPMKEFKQVNISTSAFIRFFAVVFGLVVIYMARDIIFALFFAVIIASAIEPSIEWIKRRGAPRLLAVILIYLVFAVVAALLIYLIFPLMYEELGVAAASFGKIQKQLVAGIGGVGGQLLNSFLSENTQFFLSLSSTRLQQITGSASHYGAQVFGGIFSLVLIIVFSFYLAAQEKGIENFLKLVMPLRHESYALDLWRRAQGKLGRWLRAQLLLGAIVGVFIFIGLTMLGVQQAFFFAAIAAVFEIIPIVGPILAAVPAVVTTFLSSPVLGLSVVALYLVVQQTESHVIVPVVMKKAVGLSPLIVVAALLVGAKVGGISGILLAVPVTTILAELLNDWEKRKRTFIPE